MTQDLFFGTILENLQAFVVDTPLLKSLNYASAHYKELPQVIPEAPHNIRLYEITLYGKRAYKVRVFLGFADGNKYCDYKNIKYNLRCWYQLNGYAFAEEGIDAGIVVIGTSSSWEKDVQPTLSDFPSCIKGHFLYSPSNGDLPNFGTFLQIGENNYLSNFLLMPINYRARESKIRNYTLSINNAGPFGFMGYPTLHRVASKLEIEPKELGRIWIKMEAEGLLTIRYISSKILGNSLKNQKEIYIEPTPPPLIRRLWRKIQLKLNLVHINFK